MTKGGVGAEPAPIQGLVSCGALALEVGTSPYPSISLGLNSASDLRPLNLKPYVSASTPWYALRHGLGGAGDLHKAVSIKLSIHL